MESDERLFLRNIPDQSAQGRGAGPGLKEDRYEKYHPDREIGSHMEKKSSLESIRYGHAWS